jgi:hypothetical protein
MTVSPKALEEYKEIYRKQFGKDISDTDALEQATKLLRLLEIVYKPMTEEEFAILEERRKSTQSGPAQ